MSETQTPPRTRDEEPVSAGLGRSITGVITRSALVAGLLIGIVGLVANAWMTDRSTPEVADVGRDLIVAPEIVPSNTGAASTRAETDDENPLARLDASDNELPEVPSQPRNIDPDAALIEAAIGVWTQENTGTRTLTVAPDGTATMHVNFDWLTALAMGSEVTIDIRWSIDDRVLTFESVSGRPEATFKTITNNYGSRMVREITKLDESLFVLKSLTSGKESVWYRVSSPSASTGSDPVPLPPASVNSGRE
ncbi:hypothetical protein [Stratiformator vulcanicus]|uniref:Uncharacterized protein n=1 Tax=Stratiformator vulcanicus TaxID=2527980 RepID=A0A517R297_9PLAN|nr:hypothetical protein [Stratiformator vulcanicus]QDT37988.1 hypothetical protein Pan189_23720 [Stratiformator vulcanicus]